MGMSLLVRMWYVYRSCTMTLGSRMPLVFLVGSVGSEWRGENVMGGVKRQCTVLSTVVAWKRNGSVAARYNQF